MQSWSSIVGRDKLYCVSHAFVSLKMLLVLGEYKNVSDHTLWFHQCTVGYVTTNDATTNECYNERFFFNKITMLQQMRKNTIGRRSTRVRMTCLAFPLWLERLSPSLLSYVRFSYQFSFVICLFALLAVKMFFLIILLYNFSHEPAKYSEKAN